MKNIVIILCVFSIFLSCKQSNENIKENNEKLNIQNKNGKYSWYFPNSNNLKTEANYSNDSLEGVMKTYYISGRLKTIRNYHQNKLVGDMVVFDSLGNLIEERNYADWYGSEFFLNYWKVYDKSNNIVPEESHYYIIHDNKKIYKKNNKLSYVKIEVVNPIFKNKMNILKGDISNRFEIIDKSKIDTFNFVDNECVVPIKIDSLGTYKMNLIINETNNMDDGSSEIISMFLFIEYIVIK